MADPLVISLSGVKFTPDQLYNKTCMSLISGTSGADKNIQLLGTGYQVPVGRKAIVTHLQILNGSDADNMNSIEVWYADDVGTTNAVYLLPVRLDVLSPGNKLDVDVYWEVPAEKYIMINNANNAGFEAGLVVMQFAEVDA